MRVPSSAVLAAGTLLLLGLGGCATLTGNTEQMVLVQTIQDNRELNGAGCILSNDVGKWFVTTPGRITIRKSQEPLKVDCRKHGSPAIADGRQHRSQAQWQRLGQCHPDPGRRLFRRPQHGRRL